jgi:hypothetical protein
VNGTQIGIASVLGLLAVYLYLDHESRTSQEIAQATDERRCSQARQDADFARRFGDPPALVASRAVVAERECGAIASTRAQAASQAQTSQQGRKDLQDTIGNMMK